MKKAIQAITNAGILLVFPINNKKEPDSLWQHLYPRSKMRWEWDDDGDNRVAKLWHLRAELSTSREVVYTKWYQGRATFFSLEAFINFLAFKQAFQHQPLSFEARNILDALELDSPLSTKQLKEIAELQGRSLEAQYNRTMRELWQKGLVVAFGEVEDSSFPSLAVGSTKNLFEELWQASQSIAPAQADAFLKKKLSEKNLFYKFLHRRAKT